MNTYVGKSEFGRGVFARHEIASGEIIEECPILVYDNSQTLTPDDHSFEWEDDSWCIVLGNGSIYNHSFRPNAQFVRNYATRTMLFVSLRCIGINEEITTNYNGDIYCQDPPWFQKGHVQSAEQHETKSQPQ